MQGKAATLIRGDLLRIASDPVPGAPVGATQLVTKQGAAEVIVGMGRLGLPLVLKDRTLINGHYAGWPSS